MSDNQQMMNKEEILRFWRDFFTDLLVGTIGKLFLYGVNGFGLGMSCFFIVYLLLKSLDWSIWIVWPVLFLSFGWYALFGICHGLVAVVIKTIHKKIDQALIGLHGLLDVLTRAVFEKIPYFDKSISREQLEKTFDGVASNFLSQMALKGIVGFLSKKLFEIILKPIKHYFLREVVEALRDGRAMSAEECANMIRRMGAETITNVVLWPIRTNLNNVWRVNIIVFVLSFGVPMGIVFSLTLI